MLANAAAMNYGFAFRAATYGTLSGSPRRCWAPGGHSSSSTRPHNSMYEEQVGGETAVVHRHNSRRAYPA